MTRDEASAAQIAAADPKRSTWLSANAGSGKTRVLTDRVARLLLRKVPPERILCLTYTKAAATEMQNRLFQRLGAWAMMADEPLMQNLASLGLEDDVAITSEALVEARRLFAKAIETPGGLKIQTIHSFCASILRRFPLEAGVSPNFVEMDDRRARQLRADILDHIADAHPEIMADFCAEFSGADVDVFLEELLSNSELFARQIDDAQLRGVSGVPEGVTCLHDIMAATFTGEERELIARTGPILAQQSKTMVALAQTLAGLNFDAPGPDDLEVLCEAFLYKKEGYFIPEAKFKSVPTKRAQAAIGEDLSAFQALMQRVAQAKEWQFALAAYHKTRALHRFAHVYLAALSTHKQQRAWLDFDDLILKARALLTDAGVAAWVLFRLDGGIDHILVDEAQDTAPRQWDIVRLLAQEFTTGAGAREEVERTIFVVGDQKQSIYSFQGADPEAFETMRAHFSDALERVGKPLQRRELLYSFRSSRAILDAVDASFPPELRQGMGAEVSHKAFKQNLPGRVDLWAWISQSDSAEPKDWYDPVDMVGSDHHRVVLARKIAAMIHDQLTHGQITQSIFENGAERLQTRSIEPRDFLILVQRRSELFHEIIRACKEKGLPMAGADRLKIGAELGVKDLTALLRYLATPEDDLSLAAILRSPLCGLSEAALFDLAHGRGGMFLTRVFEQNKEQFPDVAMMLQDLRDQADYLRPYDLLERILIRHNGRKKLIARLGSEAEEGITALLDQALAYEHTDIPSLTGFLGWLARDEVSIKRQADSAGNHIRVMTVHGAKGLEAPIVILPDTGKSKNEVRQDILPTGEAGHEIASWKQRSAVRPAGQKMVIEAIQSRQREERMRLLYVAMTRAESWLIICGAGETGTLENGDWYEVARAGLERAGATDEQEGLRLIHGQWPTDAPSRPASDDTPQGHRDTGFHAGSHVEPAWLGAKLPNVARPATAVSPSALGGAKARPAPDGSPSPSEEDAKRRGTALHMLLEHLPKAAPASWSQYAARLLHYLPPDERPSLLAQATQVLSVPHLKFLFAPDSLAEVTLTADLSSLGGRKAMGTIDRLILSGTDVMAVDFKSNLHVPQVPQDTPVGVLRQMGAYLEMLETIYPERRIEVAILWVQTGGLMSLPHDLVRSALSASALP